MPATINGIGTHYYGAKNRSAHVGTCKSCGRSATLSSYDTREWFCVLFIPLIPIKKYRILNECSSCRKHFRIAADEFAQKLAAATAPLRFAIRSSPRDPQPYIQLVHALIGWEMRTDAENELSSALALFPQNIDLMALAAELAIDKNDFARATALYEQAHRQDPQNAAATYGYGWVLHQTQKYEAAIPVLQRAAAQDFNKSGALYLLGKSQMALSRFNEALNSFQQLLGVQPQFQNDKQLLRLVGDCKRQVGYELTPAERKAGRRLWPFGGGAKRAKLQGQPAAVRPALRWAALIIVGLLLVGSGFYAWDRWTNLDVYFDNGLDRSVKVDLDGSPFDIARNSLHKEQLHEGSHTATVRSADGKEVERLTFALEKLNPFSALIHDRFFVYNIGTRHIYRRAMHGYAQRTEHTSYSSELIGMQRFFEQRDVDFPFSAPPESIEADANSSVVHKVSFDVAKDLDLRKFALVRLQQGRKQEAKEAMDRAVSLAPCDTATRRTEIYFASLNSPQAASDTAHRWIADCSQDDLEAHRAYQDVNRENDRDEALRDEYQKMLAASPQSGKAHYLYGRVAADSKRAIAEYQQAVALDPSLIWPHVALGHAYGSVERFDDAMKELTTALDMKGCDLSVAVYYANAAIGKGQPKEAVDKIDELVKTRGRDLSALHARWLLALASSDWDEAKKDEKLLAPLESAQTAWWRVTKRMRIQGDSSVDARIDAALRSRDLASIAVDFKIERLIETGDYTQAADQIAKNSKELDPTVAAMLDAYTAGGLLVQNDKTDADKLLSEAEKILPATPTTIPERITGAMIGGLRGTIVTDSFMEMARNNDAVTHAWFVAGVRAAQAGDRQKASESFAHCVRAAADLDFPYLEAKAIASRLR